MADGHSWEKERLKQFNAWIGWAPSGPYSPHEEWFTEAYSSWSLFILEQKEPVGLSSGKQFAIRRPIEEKEG